MSRADQPTRLTGRAGGRAFNWRPDNFLPTLWWAVKVLTLPVIERHFDAYHTTASYACSRNAVARNMPHQASSVFQDIDQARRRQLDRFYTPDPEAAGYGICGVFWFGDQRGENLPPSLRSVAEPKPALEMAIALRALQPESIRPRIAAIVFDVSGPSALASTASRAKKAKPRTCVGKTPAGKKERSHARWPRGAAARL